MGKYEGYITTHLGSGVESEGRNELASYLL